MRKKKGRHEWSLEDARERAVSENSCLMKLSRLPSTRSNERLDFVRAPYYARFYEIEDARSFGTYYARVRIFYEISNFFFFIYYVDRV